MKKSDDERMCMETCNKRIRGFHHTKKNCRSCDDQQACRQETLTRLLAVMNDLEETLSTDAGWEAPESFSDYDERKCPDKDGGDRPRLQCAEYVGDALSGLGESTSC